LTPLRLLLLCTVVVGLVVVVSVLTTGLYKTPAGEIGVVRNGGPLNNSRVRQIVQPASSLTWIGLFSSTHTYPAQQRFYTITSDAARGDRAGVDVENLPTSDGVEVGVEGTVYFTLNTDPQTLTRFDDKYGTRRYSSHEGGFYYPWEDEAGWDAFLDQVVRPVISNDLREEIGNVPCAELQASCALVQNGGNLQQVSQQAGKGNVNIAKIQDAINASLADDLKTTLGGQFIVDVRFNLAKITLPKQVQDAINQAQAAFAAVTEAQAKVQQAKAEAQANEARQQGYVACPACAQIDTLKAIPPNVTTFAPGAGFAVTAK
jgi:regulator of protease activity HflC (stomatin/prohibitin superfamily)